MVVGMGDTLHLFDHGAGRIVSVTPDLEPVRSYNVGFPVFDAVQMEPGLFIVNADVKVKTRDRFGYPFHPVRDGRVGHPMGGTAALVGSTRPGAFEMERYMVRASDSTFWAVHKPGYRFDLWRSDGTLLRVLRGEVEWFEVRGPQHSEGPREPALAEPGARRGGSTVGPGGGPRTGLGGARGCGAADGPGSAYDPELDG